MSTETALQADAFVAAVGTQSSTQPSDYGDFPDYFTDVLLADLLAAGIRRNREAMPGAANGPRVALIQSLAANGIKSILTVETGQLPATIVSVVKAIGASCLDGVEGLNEPDHDYTDPDDTWVAPTLANQSALYAAMKADPLTSMVPILGPAFSSDHSFSPGDYSAICDLGNVHLYDQPYAGAATNTHYANVLSYSQGVYTGKSLWVTETGHNTPPGTGTYAVSATIQAKYLLRNLLEKWATGSFAALTQYQFRDLGTADGQDGFGLVQHDGTQKASFTALKNLLNLLADPGATFTPGTLSFVLSGATTNVRHLVFQKRNGRFYLVLWNRVQSTDATVRASVTLALAASIWASVSIYEPNAQAAALSTVATPTSMALNVPDYPMVIELVPGTGGAAGETGTGPVATHAWQRKKQRANR